MVGVAGRPCHEHVARIRPCASRVGSAEQLRQGVGQEKAGRW